MTVESLYAMREITIATYDVSARPPSLRGTIGKSWGLTAVVAVRVRAWFTLLDFFR